MNQRLCRLLDVLDLKWSEEDLATALRPYTLLNQLAEGSMALVFEGQTETGDPVIVKLPSPTEVFARIEHDIVDRIELLKYEAQWLETVAREPIEGVVRLVANRTSDPLPFLVIEKLGPSLGMAIDTSADIPLSLCECLIVLRDVARALEQLHNRNLYHYDVKPDNILRGPRCWMLIDPSHADINTRPFYEKYVSVGSARDVLALGRTFLAACLGYEGEADVPAGYDMEDSPDLLRLLKRMLAKSRYPIPSPMKVRKLTTKILAEEYGILSPRH